jgi:hypothetical protein
MRDGSSKAVEIMFTNTDALIGSGTRPSFKIQLPKVDFFDWSPENGLEDIVTQTISFKASRDVSGGNDIISTCQLINAVSSY